MKALVTGGGGFLGSRICALLHEAGHEVLAVGRQEYPQLQAQGIACARADVRDAAAIERLSRGCGVVFHAAALAGIWGRARDFREINVQGTRHVLEACRRQGVRCLVYTSSPSVVFGRDDLCGVHESVPYAARYSAHYPASKARAERLVLEAHCPALRTLALRPHLIWGPGDPHLIPRVIERARAGRLRQVGDGRNRVDIVYIDNAAQAHVQAAEALAGSPDCGGRPYFISQGEPVLLWSWINELLGRLGIPRVTRRVSYACARRAGAALEWGYRLLRLPGEPPMTRFLADQLARSHYFDITAARRLLGYTPAVSTAQGLERLVASLRE
jgi:nucleoside-diphosphate-sugar epimerase